jgi:hypothetical protein
MSGQSLYNLAKGPDMSVLTGDFGGMIDFDILHFTNVMFLPLKRTVSLNHDHYSVPLSK